MRVFLAGIIQGSNQGRELHDQSYRDRLKRIVRTHLPEAEVCCPIDLHPAAMDYAPADQRRAFFNLVQTASEADVLVAYLPQASLGTAIEMWEAYHQGRVVVAITPMRENWVVNLLAQAVLPSVEAFEAFVRDGGLAALLESPAAHLTPRPPSLVGKGELALRRAASAAPPFPRGEGGVGAPGVETS